MAIDDLLAQGVCFIFTVQAQLRPGLKREKHTPADDRQGAKAKVRRYVFMFSCFIFFSNARGLNPLTYQADNRPHVKKHADDRPYVNKILSIHPLALPRHSF